MRRGESCGSESHFNACCFHWWVSHFGKVSLALHWQKFPSFHPGFWRDSLVFLHPEEKLPSTDGFNGPGSQHGLRFFHWVLSLFPQKFNDGTDLYSWPFSVFTLKFFEVMFEERDVFGLFPFANFFAFLHSWFRWELKFLDFQIVKVRVGVFFLFIAFDPSGLLVAFCKVSLAGSGKRFYIECDRGGHLCVKVGGFLLIGLGLPFLDDFPNNVWLSEVGKLFLELIVPFPGEVSVGIGESTGVASILS